ncbi:MULTISPECIES: hypothetical protein [unclassified Methylobacterium]|uniref:CopG family ribbon-helix-helix protein n=1 Tax=unclassified Methylobacterium TaxID=2615210 RepID=UPI001FBBA97D|nr:MULTISPECIES: hypothetical protein [unclassified Methylobacterium]MCJ2016991.1 hypothetical protein [Methylobacterium sp. E-065]
MGEATFTFQVDEALKTAFSQVARERDRNDAQLLRDFMHAYVQQQRDETQHDAWFRRQVQIGLDSAKSGRVIPTEDVEARFAAKRSATQRRLNALK